MMKLARMISVTLTAVLLFSSLTVVSAPARAQQGQLPDLIISGAWQTDGQICYSIKNIGNASVGGAVAPTDFYNALFINGQQVAEDHFTVSLAPGQQLDRCFNYQWQAIPGQHNIMVCADRRQDVAESNEYNNCWETVWGIEAELPDLVVVDIRQEGDRIRYKIENVGQAGVVNPLGVTTSFCNALFIDSELVAKDYVSIYEMMPGQWIDNPFDYYWEMTPPQHTIKVCADWEQNVDEENEENNCSEETWYTEEELPDLIIDEIKCDRENSRIGYVLKNIGEGTVKGEHSTTLFVDGKEVSDDLAGVDLEAGVTYESWFEDYKWPEGNTITAKVCADSYNKVEEADEQNNCLEKVCECIVDITPLRIIAGPTVSQVTQTSVVICWETDEASDSLVTYDNHAGEYGLVVEDFNLVREHCLTLTGLNSATTYHFVVESRDSSGNQVRSRDLNFETLSPTDNEKPFLSLLVPDTLSGKALISADAQDNTGVDRVVFFLDGEPVFTDYAHPFEWECDTGAFDEGFHDFGTKVFDVAGNMAEDTRRGDARNQLPEDFSPVRVHIIAPEPEAEVYGEVPIGVKITHDLGSKICYIRFELDERIIWEKDYVEELGYCVGVPGVPLFETCFWDFSGLRPGSTHYIEAGVEDEHGNWGHTGIRVRISEPELAVSRDVTRHGNYFEVTLTIENIGEVGVDNLSISDTNMAFQCLEMGWIRGKPSDGDWLTRRLKAYEVRTTMSGCNSSIATDLGALQPNEAYELSYYAVPVLTYREETYAFGQPLQLSYRAGGRGSIEYPPTTWFVSSEETNGAFLDADYLIVTNTEKLFEHNHPNDDDVHELLATMAELAKEKNGVLGYLPYGSRSAYTIRRYFGSAGAWYEKLVGPGEEGSFNYMLLVGETEIIPSFYPTTDSISFYGLSEKTGGDIDCSDYPYADILGDDLRPDLRVGRIVGDDAETLVKPIIASINVHQGLAGHTFDRSAALLVSGGEGTWEQFVDDTNQIGDILSRHGTTDIDKVYREYLTTEVHLLREALVILGTMWDCLPPDYRTSFPDELEHLSDLTCVYDCMEELTADTPHRHILGYDDDGNEILCDKTHPPMDLTSLYQLISIEDAILVEEVRRNGDVTETYDYHYANGQAWNVGTAMIAARMPDKDIFYMNAHGNRGAWTEFNRDFGGSHPLVFALSCLTGAYEAKIDPVMGDFGGYGAPESSFKAGAAVFIGSTEVSLADAEHGFEFVRKFFDEYWLPEISCGDALTELKDWMWMTGDPSFRYTTYEFNLYGDPKFGE